MIKFNGRRDTGFCFPGGSIKLVVRGKIILTTSVLHKILRLITR